jgi:hypothetical protein
LLVVTASFSPSPNFKGRREEPLSSEESAAIYATHMLRLLYLENVYFQLENEMLSKDQWDA